MASSAYPEPVFAEESAETLAGAPGAAAQDQIEDPDSIAVFDGADLPDPIRARITELAAAALAGLVPDDVPRQLHPVARFAPAKRAKLGGAALLGALRDSAQFRTAVLKWLREHRQDALNSNDDDPVAAAAAAVLLGEASAASRVRLVAQNTHEATLRAERDAALARERRLKSEVDRLGAELAQVRVALEQARGEQDAELDRLRGKLREQGVAVRRAKDAAAEAEATAQRALAERDSQVHAVTAQLERERNRAAAERVRAERAEAEAGTARQAAREARDADEVRLSLLLDTLNGAVQGLRRELPVADPRRRPADTARGASAAEQGGRVGDSAKLDLVLKLPQVHVIVDGYNITKTGYPELTLAEQRHRLVGQLSALGSRTGIEITVVFDGADVLSIPVAGPRGVRVLFSDPGVSADEVIVSLVRSEPEGRPLIVATSDAEIVISVCRAGAYAVPAAVLLTRLGHV